MTKDLTLDEWMKLEGKSVADVMNLLNHKKPDSVKRWMNLDCVPHKSHRDKLQEISKGRITRFI